MTEVTFVVPTRNNATTIEACLRSCRRQDGADVEVILVDNHSTDGTPDFAAGIADQVVTAGPERSAQRNLGVRLAAAPLVAIIDSDMRVHAGVARQLVDAFAQDPELGAVVLPEHAVGDGVWGACRRLEKRLYLGMADVEAARGFRRDVFLAVGGYDENLTGAEDWDLPDRVIAAGWRLGRISAGVDHNDTVTSLLEAFRKKRYYGRGVGSYLDEAGSRARPLARWGILRQTGPLLERPEVTVALGAIKAVEALGIAIGIRDHRRSVRRRGCRA